MTKRRPSISGAGARGAFASTGANSAIRSGWSKSLTLTHDWLNRFGWPDSLATGAPLAIAHRGASDHAPENTLSAFRLAADLEAEIWELDARLTKDGVCVVSHDDDLTRLAGRGILVSEADWAEISRLRLPDGEHIPRLEEVIALASETGCGLYVDIKSEGAGSEAWRLLREADCRFAALGAFDTGWVTELREAGCDYPLSVLVPVGADPFAHVGDSRADIVHLCWREASDAPHELLTDALVTRLIEGGYQIVTWHEDRAPVIDALLEMPILGICSDRPELLKPHLQSRANEFRPTSR